MPWSKFGLQVAPRPWWWYKMAGEFVHFLRGCDHSRRSYFRAAATHAQLAWVLARLVVWLWLGPVICLEKLTNYKLNKR
jgi:hypothetical protein